MKEKEELQDDHSVNQNFPENFSHRIEEELLQLKNSIIEELDKSKKELKTFDTASQADSLVRATDEGERILKLRFSDREKKLLDKIETALARLKNGTYGYCEVCEKRINFKRLLARPVTDKCFSCKTLEEENEN